MHIVTVKQKTKKNSRLDVRRHIRHALVPHKGNHYRPHLLRLHGITAVLVIALLMQVVYGYATAGRLEVLGRVSNMSVSELLTDTNKERAEQSLPELKINEKLSQAAFLKAQDMIAENYWAHTSPSGESPWKWMADAGYSYDIAGENLAKNYPTAEATVSAWMNSETHRANILNDRYQDVGFAVVDGLLDGRDTTIIVALYGTPSTAAIQGVENRQAVYAAPVTTGIGNPLTYFGSALQSLSPATLGALALFALVGIVGLIAHQYRRKLPASWRKTWRQHHAMYTVIGVAGLGVLVVMATGGGQI